MKGYLLIVLLLLFVWASKDKLPAEYQFWKKDVATVTVQNNSGQDLQEVALVVFSAPYQVGTIKKDRDKTVTVRRLRESTEVVIRFTHGSETVERHAGTLDEEDHYKMTIIVTLGGVIVVQENPETTEEDAVATP